MIPKYQEPAQEEMAIFSAAETLYEDWADNQSPRNLFPAWKDTELPEREFWVRLAKATILRYRTAY